MGTITAKQLKQKTGDVIKRIKSGERLTLTYRGKPLAVIEPTTEKNLNKLNTIIMYPYCFVITSYDVKDDLVDLKKKVKQKNPEEANKIDFDKIYYESNTYLLGKKLVDEGLEKGVRLADRGRELSELDQGEGRQHVRPARRGER